MKKCKINPEIVKTMYEIAVVMAVIIPSGLLLFGLSLLLGWIQLNVFGWNLNPGHFLTGELNYYSETGGMVMLGIMMAVAVLLILAKIIETFKGKDKGGAWIWKCE